VTGYFTVGALAYLSKETKDKIDEYKFILGDIVSFDFDKDRALDLLNEDINIDASLKLSKVAQEAVAFLELEKFSQRHLNLTFATQKHTYTNTTTKTHKRTITFRGVQI
jgi:hypothetical protein